MRRTKIDRKRFLKTERLKRRKNPIRTFAFSKSLRDKRPENRRSAYFPILSKAIRQAKPTKFSKSFSLRLSAAFFMRQRRPRFPFSSGHPTSADVRSRIFESFSPFQEKGKSFERKGKALSSRLRLCVRIGFQSDLFVGFIFEHDDRRDDHGSPPARGTPSTTSCRWCIPPPRRV